MPPDIKVRVLGQAATGPAFAIATDEVRTFGGMVRSTMEEIGRSTSTAAGATATAQGEMVDAAARARAALGDVGTAVVALRQRESELTNELKLGRITTAEYGRQMEALQARVAQTATAVQVGTREHERLAQVAGRVQTALRQVAAQGVTPLEQSVTELTQRERSLADQHQLGAINAQQYQAAIEKLQADVATLAVQTSAGSDEQARLAQVAGAAERALNQLDFGAVSPLAGEIAALTQRQRELDQQMALGTITLGEYQARAQTLKADIAELAAGTNVGSREHERLANVAGTVNQSLSRLSAQERRNVDSAEAVAAGVQTMSSVMSGGGVAAVTGFTSVLQRFSRGSPAMVSFLGGAGAIIGVVALITAQWKKAAAAAEEAQQAQDAAVARAMGQFQTIRRQMTPEERHRLEVENLEAGRAELTLRRARPLTAIPEAEFTFVGESAVVANERAIAAARAVRDEEEAALGRLEARVRAQERLVATNEENLALNRQTTRELEGQQDLVRALGEGDAAITIAELMARRGELMAIAPELVAQMTNVQLAEYMRAEREIAANARQTAHEFGEFLRREMPELSGEGPLARGPQLFGPGSPFDSASLWDLADRDLRDRREASDAGHRRQDQMGLGSITAGIEAETIAAIAAMEGLREALDISVPARQFTAEWANVSNALADGTFAAGIESMAAVLTGSARGLSGFGKMFAGIMGDVLITAGKSAIGIGTFAEALRKALSNVFAGGGLGAIAIGAGLIALGGLIRGAAGSAVSQIGAGFGGYGTGAGSTIGADLSSLAGSGRGGETTVNLYGDRFTADELGKLLEELRDRRIGEINFLPVTA